MKTRLCYLDYLRFFSILGVILIHCSQKYCLYINNNIYGFFINYLGRFGVPCFVMISGVLFLNKDISLKLLYKKYIFRLFVCLDTCF